MSLGSPGHAPVAGTANGAGISAVVTLDGRDRFRILLNRKTRESVKVAPGDTIEFALTRDPSQKAPPVPDDLMDAIDAIDGTQRRWDGLDPTHQRELLTWIAEAKTAMNRSRRIARTLARVWE